jgi:hypothetical protein
MSSRSIVDDDSDDESLTPLQNSGVLDSHNIFADTQNSGVFDSHNIFADFLPIEEPIVIPNTMTIQEIREVIETPAVDYSLTRIENPQYTVAELPEHVLIDIFMFLNPYQTYSGKFRIRRLDVFNDHTKNAQMRNDKRQDRQIKKEDLVQKNNLGLVCRNWRAAACDDVLWRAQAVYLHKQLCVKIKRPQNGHFIETKSRRMALEYSTHRYLDRIVNRKCLSLKNLELGDLPRENFKDHYFKLIKKREVLVDKMVRTERKDTAIANWLIRFQYLCEVPYHLILINLLYWILMAQVILLIVFWFTSYDNSYYVYFLAPIMLLCTAMVAGIPLMIYSIMVMNEHEFTCDNLVTALLVLIGIGIWFESTPIFMIVMNLGILPRYPMRLFHNELIPWPVVLFPWALTFFVLGVFATVAGSMSLSSKVKKEGMIAIRNAICGESSDYRWMILGVYSLFSISFFWVLLGFSLEFWNYFFIPISFIPLFIMEIIAQIPVALWAFKESRNEYTSRKDKFISYNLMVFPTVLIISEIPCCFAQLIGPFCFLGPMIAFTQVVIFATTLITENDMKRSCFGDRTWYTQQQLLCCADI